MSLDNKIKKEIKKIKNILVVDDDQIVLDYIDLILNGNGYSCHPVANGEVALRYAKEHPVDLAIIDIHMPGMDGLELIREFRTIAPSLPVVAISGGALFGDTMFLTAAERFGAVGCLVKPVNETDLISVVHRVEAGPRGS